MAAARSQQQDGNIVQRLRASRQTDFLLLPKENENPAR
jgi:hypothetical protein